MEKEYDVVEGGKGMTVVYSIREKDSRMVMGERTIILINNSLRKTCTGEYKDGIRIRVRGEKLNRRMRMMKANIV